MRLTSPCLRALELGAAALQPSAAAQASAKASLPPQSPCSKAEWFAMVDFEDDTQAKLKSQQRQIRGLSKVQHDILDQFETQQ